MFAAGVVIELPEGARISWTSWSPDSSRLAYTLESEAGSNLRVTTLRMSR